jgi:hypothetical protein
MPNVFSTSAKRGDYDGYFTTTLNQKAAGLYGSTRANTFIRDAKDKRDCVDIVLVGDSNINFNSRGWCYAWEFGMANAGAVPYATCLTPFTHSSSTNVNAGWGIGVSYAHLQAGAPAWTLVGSTAAAGIGASAAVNTYWNNDSNNLRTWAVGLNWLYVSSTTPQEAGNYTQLGGASSLNPRQELVYRVGYIKFPFGSGQFTQMCYAPDYSATVAEQIRQTKAVQTVDTEATNFGLQITEMTVAADQLRGNTRFGCLGQGYGTSYGPIGPVGIIFDSIYAKVKGFAVNVFHYYPGAQTNQTAQRTATDNAQATIRTYLKELRERQIAAGGSGRVLVFINSSINDVGGATIGSWDFAANSVITNFKKAWISLGYPMSSLAFVASRTHPTEAGDANQQIASTLGKLKVQYGTNGDVTFLDTNEFAPHSYLTANSFYDAGGNSHLIAGGYGELGNLLVASLLR